MGMRGAILLDDPTSSGGRIISASGLMNVDGKPVACVGDKATCHLEGHGGTVTIVEGSSSDIMMGRMIAYDGCALSCGCRAMATTTRYMLEPNRGGTGSPVMTSGPVDSSRSHIVPVMDIHEPDSALPITNQRAIAVLKPIAENEQGKQDDVLVMFWNWKNLGFVGPHHSVGHVAVAVAEQTGEWRIVQSQFPHGPGEESRTTGPNTTISHFARLRLEEGGRLPSSAYRVTLPNIGAYAQEAICDLRKPLWQCDPRWTITRLAENETNCTYGVIKALKAGGASFDGLTAARYLTPIGCWLPNDLSSYLCNEKDFNVLRERNSLSEQWFVHDGMQLARSLPWEMGVTTA